MLGLKTWVGACWLPGFSAFGLELELELAPQLPRPPVCREQPVAPRSLYPLDSVSLGSPDAVLGC